MQKNPEPTSVRSVTRNSKGRRDNSRRRKSREGEEISGILLNTEEISMVNHGVCHQVYHGVIRPYILLELRCFKYWFDFSTSFFSCNGWRYHTDKIRCEAVSNETREYTFEQQINGKYQSKIWCD